jgi:hypothetical protein
MPITIGSNKKPLLWSEKVGNHIYVYWRGQLVYKKWIDPKGNKTQSSILINKNGWPNEWINP